ncbi:hypothetical protein N750_00115 [Legionella pneumophila str. Leg01/53]|nr:hypothetical protein N750_00115 [Legionella pneumophila str. Leg01/53]
MLFLAIVPFHILFLCDPRINLDSLRSKLGEFPDNPRSQNLLWYSLLKKHESNITVKEAHQYFLLFRDATSMTLIIFLLFFASTFFLRNTHG